MTPGKFLNRVIMMTDEIKVWDLFVRVFHWSLVAAFFIAYFTGDEIIAVHVWAGYAVGGLIILRVVWGFIGPQHARFSDFIYGPRAVFGYLRDLVSFRSKRYLGHSPAGGAMVVALLLGLSVIVGTGLVVYALRDNAGPLAGIVTAGGSAIAESPRAATKVGEAWEDIHELMANVLLVLIGLHVASVILSSFAHHENLVRAMITGRKPPNPS